MWCGKFEYPLFCSLSPSRIQFQKQRKFEAQRNSKLYIFSFPIIFKTTVEIGGVLPSQKKEMKKGGDFTKNQIHFIRNPKLFVPLVKVINSMPEQNLHQLNFRKILKLWHSATQSVCKSWWGWSCWCVLILGGLLEQVKLWDIVWNWSDG